jgi:hypothetical protein
MAASPLASRTLYRNRWRSVTLAGLALFLAVLAAAQFAGRPKADKGPRALALLELSPNGKGRLIPVVIMIDGEFYDASAYKAAPVPMALDTGTVYEAERTGTSLGLFTVSGALPGPSKSWLGAGTWQPAGSAPRKTVQKAESKPRGIDMDEENKPPVLHRRSEPESPKPAAPPPAQPNPPATPPPPATTPPATSAPPAAPVAPPPPAAAPEPAAPEPAEDDSNRPILRRGKLSPLPNDDFPAAPAPAGPSGKAAAPANSALAAVSTGGVQVIPAISDADGPDPHPYTYPMKPGEEDQFRTKTLAMAAIEIRARVQQLVTATVGAPPPSRAPRAGKAAPAPKSLQPIFGDVQFHVFDLSSSNQPVLVLAATAHMPPGRNTGPPGLEYAITLVARSDIYGDLHKVFSALTDTAHLDVLPRYDLIDAVDADGDGRGELLFRKVSDAGSAFALYRVIGNQLWPLFEGTPGL